MHHTVCFEMLNCYKSMDGAVTVYKPLHQCIEVTPPLRVTVWVGSVKYSTLREHITQALHFTNISFVHHQVC